MRSSSASVAPESRGLFSFTDVSVRIRYEDEDLARQAGRLDQLLEPFHPSPLPLPRRGEEQERDNRRESGTAAVIDLLVTRNGSGFRIAEDSPPHNFWLCKDRHALVPFLEWVIHQLIAQRLSHAVTLHAGVAGPVDRPILLLGSSGVGKSTLVLELMKGGWSYWSDDLAVIDVDHRCVPYPKAIKFEGRHPRRARLSRGTMLSFRIGHRAYRYLRLWRMAGFHWGRPAPVAGMVVLARCSADPPRLAGLSPAQAMEGLLAHACLNKAQLAEKFDTVCQLAERVPAARLSMGRSVKDNARLVREFARQGFIAHAE